MKACNRHLKDTLHLVDEMLALADRGDTDREDVGCGILFGTMRDAAYKLKQLVEKERTAHERSGRWP